MGDRTELLNFKDFLLSPGNYVRKEMIGILPKLPAQKEDIFITSYLRSGLFKYQGPLLLTWSENYCNAKYDLLWYIQPTGQGIWSILMVCSHLVRCPHCEYSRLIKAARHIHAATTTKSMTVTLYWNRLRLGLRQEENEMSWLWSEPRSRSPNYDHSESNSQGSFFSLAISFCTLSPKNTFFTRSQGDKLRTRTYKQQ